MEANFAVVETGGSIGECDTRGNVRVSSLHATKEGAVEKRKAMTRTYSGGYFDYHFSVKPIDWAKAHCRASEFENRSVVD